MCRKTVVLQHCPPRPPFCNALGELPPRWVCGNTSSGPLLGVVRRASAFQVGIVIAFYLNLTKTASLRTLNC